MADKIVEDEVSPLLFHSSSIPKKIYNRTPFQRKTAVWIILFAVGFERLAFYSLGGNLVLFLTSDTIQWTPAHGVTGSLYFFGASYISALIFSWISDAKLGRAKTILLGFILYAGGYIFMPLFAHTDIINKLCLNTTKTSNTSIIPYWSEHCNPQMTAILVIAAIGIGAVQTNMSVFGAEQLREHQSTTQYFDRYYIAVNIGALLAFGVLSYIHLNVTWHTGHIIATSALCITIILFLVGFKFYTHVEPHDSILTNFFPVLINAFQTRRKQRNYAKSVHYERRPSKILTESREDEYLEDSVTYVINEQPKSFLDYAKRVNNGKYPDHVVNDIKALRPVIILFLLLVPYWMIFLQTETTFIVQGVHMEIPRLKLDAINLDHTMPLIWLSLADQIVIIISILILNTCVYKYLHAKNKRLSMKTRLILGMVAAAIAMLITGVVEIYRQEQCNNGNSIEQRVGKINYTAAPVSVFLQFPQYIAIGVSEVFTSVASLEFAYLAAPKSAQSLVMSLRFSTIGLSSLTSSGYVNIYQAINRTFPLVENKQCLDEDPKLFYIYFFVLALIQLLFILIFLGCDRKYHLLKTSEQRINTRLFMVSSSRRSDT